MIIVGPKNSEMQVREVVLIADSYCFINVTSMFWLFIDPLCNSSWKCECCSYVCYFPESTLTRWKLNEGASQYLPTVYCLYLYENPIVKHRVKLFHLEMYSLQCEAKFHSSFHFLGNHGNVNSLYRYMYMLQK